MFKEMCGGEHWRVRWESEWTTHYTGLIIYNLVSTHLTLGLASDIGRYTLRMGCIWLGHYSTGCYMQDSNIRNTGHHE